MQDQNIQSPQKAIHQNLHLDYFQVLMDATCLPDDKDSFLMDQVEGQWCGSKEVNVNQNQMREQIQSVGNLQQNNGQNEIPFTENEEDLLKIYEEEDKGNSDEDEEYAVKGVYSQVSAEDRENLIIKNKTKLEKLLAQPDIFDCLRRINSGQIKSYDDLQINPGASKNDNQSRRRAGDDKDEIEELNNLQPEILKIEGQPANLIGGQLRDYQVEGLNWLYKLQQANLNGILADEMGLGKTIQSIAILALMETFKSEEEKQNRQTHHIVIVPKIVLGKWRKEIIEWAPSIRLFYFYGTNEEREAQKQELRRHQYDVILTTFETVIREKNELARQRFEFLILDEAQRIKNDQSVLSQVLRKFKTKHRILLTGTPLQNNLKELWALLNFLMPKLFDSSDEFKELFQVKSDQSQAQEYIIKQIHRLLRPFMLRRLKSDVEKNLAQKKEIYLFIGLSKMQKTLYKHILSGNIDVVNGIGGDKIKLLNVLMQLKKVCNHPYLFDKVEPGPPFVDGEHIIDAAMKFKVLDLLIPKLLQEDCKILIFSQMTRLLDILDDFLRFRGYKYCRIDGQTSANDREDRIDDFQKPDSDKQLFILSTRAGGLGINLHSANIVIIFDSDWNPQVDLQAIDRAHRIGQKRQVIVYRFVTEGSVEEKIVERAARKLKVDHLIMQKGKFNHSTATDRVSAQEMVSMIKYGAQEIIHTESEGTIVDQDIEKIMNHSMKKTDEINKEMSKIEDKFNLNNVSLTGEDEKQTDLYMFEGEDYKRNKQNQNNELEFIDIGQRERKQLSYDIDKYYRDALNIQTQSKEKKKLKGWRAHANGGYDHQLFENAKLDALDEKELNWNQYQQNQEEYLKNNNNQKPVQFTKKDIDYKERLLRQGYSNWSKKDFFLLIRTCEQYGRQSLQKIAEQFPTKSFEEVKEYMQVLSKNWDRIDNSQKYIERIEKGELEIEKQRQIDQAIDDKFKYSLQQFLKNNDNADASSFNIDNIMLLRNDKKQQINSGNLFDYSEDEDRFLCYCLFKYGYGYWELIRNEIRNSNKFMFNWAVKSRTIADIQKRCDYLVSQFKKEILALKKIEEERQRELAEQEKLAAAKRAKTKVVAKQVSKQKGKRGAPVKQTRNPANKKGKIEQESSSEDEEEEVKVDNSRKAKAALQPKKGAVKQIAKTKVIQKVLSGGKKISQLGKRKAGANSTIDKAPSQSTNTRSKRARTN